jgi:hypothetical protein
MEKVVNKKKKEKKKILSMAKILMPKNDDFSAIEMIEVQWFNELLLKRGVLRWWYFLAT